MRRGGRRGHQPASLLQEIDSLVSRGVHVAENLMVSTGPT